MDFGEAVRQFYGNYANPEGRAQRSAYWWVLLYQLIIYVVLIIVIFMAEGGDQLWAAIMSSSEENSDLVIDDDFHLGRSGVFAIFLFIVFAIANFLPDIMLSIRRFHDLGQTGWLVLVFKVVGALPVIGVFAGIANLIWFASAGTKGSNQYGPDPLEQNTDIFG